MFLDRDQFPDLIVSMQRIPPPFWLAYILGQLEANTIINAKPLLDLTLDEAIFLTHYLANLRATELIETVIK